MCLDGIVGGMVKGWEVAVMERDGADAEDCLVEVSRMIVGVVGFSREGMAVRESLEIVIVVVG